ncbi:INSI1 protein, partial [Mesembrinibis cayennensis]|nr:INSI1 protein [Mesembrinibis cayennensis]
MPRLENCAWSRSRAARGRHKAQLGETAAGLAAKVGEMLSSSVSSPSLALVGHGARGPAGPAGTLNLSQHLVQRSVVLFVVGAFMALVLNLLQIQRNVTLFPDEVISTLFSSAWWVPPCCGTAAGECLAPTKIQNRAPFQSEFSLVQFQQRDVCRLKRIVLNIFFQKLDFANNVQLSLTLAALSLGLWWTFDRSRSGLGLGITIAFVATLITQFLVYNGVYQYTSPDFLYIRSWLPCIFFSGGVTVGNIGRQLAMVI